MIEEVIEAAGRVRARVPLVHNITNYVTVNDVANAELAIGGSALMADEIEEMRDIVSIANAVNLNMGTLNRRTIKSMHEAGKVANSISTPVVFDPVGAGASTLRNQTAESLLKTIKPTVIRGNISEISFIAGIGASTRGVDAAEQDSENDQVDIAVKVARTHNCVAAITGATDVITDGETIIKIDNGEPLMSKITGTGCMCDGLIGCFIGAVDENDRERQTLVGCAAAILSMGIAGQKGAEMVKARDGKVGTGSLRVAIIDALSTMCNDDYRNYSRIEVI